MFCLSYSKTFGVVCIFCIFAKLCYAKTREAYIKTGGDIRQKIGEIKLHKQEDSKAVVFAEISTDILVDGEWMGNKGVILFSLIKQEDIWKIDHIGE